jgi:hypothetical protein
VVFFFSQKNIALIGVNKNKAEGEVLELQQLFIKFSLKIKEGIN